VTRYGLSHDAIKSVFLALPPLPEQSAIVRFLDHADRRIRRYIRAKKKLIALLNEQKQAIIHRAVTHGLDPNVRLKPSGVEWLGDVPEHWEGTRLKAVLSRPLRNGLFKKKDAFGSGVPLVNVADVYRNNFQIDPVSLERVHATPDEIRTYRVRSGDLFFVRSSLKLEGTGRSAVAFDCQSDAVFECHLVQGHPDPRRANARFLAFQLNSFSLRNYLISRANVVTMATIAQDVLASCPVLLPPVPEQGRLLKQIDSQCEQVDVAIDRAQREIDLLREYRPRLISDVVTGKLDVREAAARLPVETEEPEPLDDADALAEGNEEAEGANLDATPEEAEA
jgi:type I restriction enzyme S subunit